jgi:hypothetical protein
MGIKKANRIIFVLIAEDNLSTAMNQNEGMSNLSNKPDYYNPEQMPEVGELADALQSGFPTMEAHQADELETFVGSKKQDLAVDSSRPLQSRNFRMGIRRPQCGDI